MIQHGSFGGQHTEQVTQSGLIAPRGDGISVFCRVLRRALLGLLTRDGLRGGELIGHITHGINHGGVVALDGSVQISRFATQIGTQATPVKERQTQCRAHAPLLAARAEQAIQPNAGETGKSDQIDVGIKLALGTGDVLTGGLDAPAGCSNVSAATQQVGGHGRRNYYFYSIVRRQSKG